jgi:hypothetical protein
VTPPTRTSEEWLAAHRAADADEDPHRVVTEADLTTTEDADVLSDEGADVVDRVDHRSRDGDAAAGRMLESGIGDLREVAAEEPAQVADDVVRVPSADESANTLDRAERAMAEIRARQAEDELEAQQHREAELRRWHAQDHDLDTTDVDTDGFDGADVLDHEPAWSGEG